MLPSSIEGTRVCAVRCPGSGTSTSPTSSAPSVLRPSGFSLTPAFAAAAVITHTRFSTSSTAVVPLQTFATTSRLFTGQCRSISFWSTCVHSTASPSFAGIGKLGQHCELLVGSSYRLTATTQFSCLVLNELNTL